MLLMAGFAPVFAFAQTGNALLGESRTSAPAAAPAPEHPPLSPEMRGDIFLARKMYREAIEAFREGAPDNPILHNKIGIAFHQMLQLDQARKEYQQAVRLDPKYEEAINNIGTIYYARKSYRRAGSYFARAIKLAPDDPKTASVYVNLGSAYFSRKKYQQAAESFQHALALDPEVFERHGNFGVMMEERTVEERAKYHFYLAKMYAKSGRNELALQYLRKALEEGFRDKKIEETPEFSTLRTTQEFKDLMKLEPRVL
jgi:tetratricopeptide (TPR) repeat protein